MNCTITFHNFSKSIVLGKRNTIEDLEQITNVKMILLCFTLHKKTVTIHLLGAQQRKYQLDTGRSVRDLFSIRRSMLINL